MTTIMFNVTGPSNSTTGPSLAPQLKWFRTSTVKEERQALFYCWRICLGLPTGTASHPVFVVADLLGHSGMHH